MDRADAAQRLAELREAIRHHDYAYYVEAKPDVADVEYDALRRELTDLEAEFPELVTPDSPSQRVAGQPVDAFRPVEHTVAMLSLDNATTPDHLREFESDTEIGSFCGDFVPEVSEHVTQHEPYQRLILDD